MTKAFICLYCAKKKSEIKWVKSLDNFCLEELGKSAVCSGGQIGDQITYSGKNRKVLIHFRRRFFWK